MTALPPTPAVTVAATPAPLLPGDRGVTLRSTITSSTGFATTNIPTTVTLRGTGPLTVNSATSTPRGAAGWWFDVTFDIPPTAASGLQMLTICVTDLGGRAGCADVPVVIRAPAPSQLGFQTMPGLPNVGIPSLPATSTNAATFLALSSLALAFGASLLRRPGRRPARRGTARFPGAPSRTISRRLDGRARAGVSGRPAVDAQQPRGM